MPRPPRFTIRAASALTGINQNTLRAWERRYGLIRPQRSPKGYRLYSDDDIERLRLVQRTLQEGIPVGRVSARLEAMATADPAMATVDPAVDDATLAAFAEQILQAALRSDRPALECAFARAVGIYSVRQAFHDALLPAFGRLAQRDPDGAAPGLLTEFARERLRSVLAGLRPLHQPPRVLFVCAPGAASELPLMLLALEVALEGVSALYLGPATRLEVLQRTAATPGLRAVVLSTAVVLPREAVLETRDRLAALPNRPRILFGGMVAREDRGWFESVGIEVLAAELGDAARQVLRDVGRP